MTRSFINICLIAVISLLFGVIWQGNAIAAMPIIQPLGQLAEGMNVPNRLAADGAGNIYVANAGSHNVVRYDAYGNYLGEVGVVQVSGLGLAVSEDGQMIYAATSDRVVVVDPSGQLLFEVGTGLLGTPGAMALDKSGHLLVADMSNGTVQIFAVDGTSLGQLTGVSFGSISSIAVDPVSGEIYVADPSFNGVQTPQLYVFSGAYSLLRQYDAASGTVAAPGVFGASRLQFFGGMAFDGAGRLFVGDVESGDLRVVELPAASLGLYDDANAISRPVSMIYVPSAVAGTGRLYVTWNGIRVDVYGVDGGVMPVKQNIPPTVPVPVTVGEVSSLTPALTFNNATDADQDPLTYNVQILAGTTVVEALNSVPSGAVQTTAVGTGLLVENASYLWQVQANDGKALSAWSAPVAITVNATPETPTAPVLDSFLAGEDATSDSLLTWVAAQDPDPNSSISYQVQVTEGSRVVASRSSSVAEVGVANFSADLVPGSTYLWSVRAIDDTGLSVDSANVGSFVYRASVLKITANVPGARVSLSGHYGYSGRLAGTAPLDVRDLAAGDYAVVVEAAGFVPYVGVVTVTKNTETSLAVVLKGERLTDTYLTHTLSLNGVAVASSDAAIVADIDLDGVLDILLAAGGNLSFYPGQLQLDPNPTFTLSAPISTKPTTPVSDVVFGAPQALVGVPQIPGAYPCLVDWNNDDIFDLLIGTQNGVVKLYLGQGGLNFVDGGDLTYVVGRAIPAVADMDGDNKKDLIVADGMSLFQLLNVGTDAAPVLNGQQLLLNHTSAIIPMLADLDSDGSRELMLLSDGNLMQVEMSAGAVTSLIPSATIIPGSTSVSPISVEGSHFMDLLFTTNNGLIVANGNSGSFAPAYKQVLVDKTAEVEQLLLVEDPSLVGKFANISSLIVRTRYSAANKKAQRILNMLGVDSPASIALKELMDLLP